MLYALSALRREHGEEEEPARSQASLILQVLERLRPSLAAVSKHPLTSNRTPCGSFAIRWCCRAMLDRHSVPFRPTP